MRRALAAALRRLRWLLPLLAIGLLTPPAAAHELTMAELNLRETAKGRFLWHWGASSETTPIAESLTPRWPEGCAAEQQSLRCPPAGLVGALSVDGIGDRYSAAMVRIQWLDGQRRVYTITSAQPSVQLHGAVDDQRGRGEIVKAYTVLGVEHILGGIDHLLFVVCLLFLVGFRRRLVWTITAFTAAHSLTLVGSVLGLVSLRSGPVEAVIALSIVLTAAEALRRRDTLSRRLPALVAFGFGLVHGLGFAGALADIGLPENHLPLALLSFNAGVEIGQLLTVGAAYLLSRVLARYGRAEALSRPVLYMIGVLAAYWSWLRVASIVA